MFRYPRAWGKRRWRAVISLGVGLCLVCFFWPGLSAVRARLKTQVDGRTLFEHEWTENDPLADGDGLGPVYNARSCVACHFQGGVGGAGTRECNVLAFEVPPDEGSSVGRGGVVHNFAVRASLKENPEWVSGTRADSINTPALFGAGLIDRISDADIKHNAGVVREWGDPVKGRVRLLPDGRVGKFGWRNQFATLEEFVAAACANELGLGTPLGASPSPLRKKRYWTGPADLDRRQLAALVGFVDSLPRPVRQRPAYAAWREPADRGEALFHKIGCATCHTPDLGGVQGIYSDLLLHRVVYYGDSGTGPAPAPSDYPLPDEWKTPPLWGVADSAPYFHDGACETLHGAIVRHEGEAKQVTEAYKRLSPAEQEQLLAFLRTLKAPPDAAPARGPGAELLTGEFPLQPPTFLSGGDW
jgi:CxxC motif-containing protein (DUF1111 family)